MSYYNCKIYKSRINYLLPGYEIYMSELYILEYTGVHIGFIGDDRDFKCDLSYIKQQFSQ